MLQELILENKAAAKPNLDELHVEEQRNIAKKLEEQAIEKYNPGYGIFDGLNYDYYVNSQNPEMQDIVSSQLNFTKNIFEQAQIVKAQIIADGGTYEEAQQAYLETLSIPKEKLEEFNAQKLEEPEIESSEENSEEIEEKNN